MKRERRQDNENAESFLRQKAGDSHRQLGRRVARKSYLNLVGEKRKYAGSGAEGEVLENLQGLTDECAVQLAELEGFKQSFLKHAGELEDTTKFDLSYLSLTPHCSWRIVQFCWKVANCKYFQRWIPIPYLDCLGQCDECI